MLSTSPNIGLRLLALISNSARIVLCRLVKAFPEDLPKPHLTLFELHTHQHTLTQFSKLHHQIKLTPFSRRLPGIATRLSSPSQLPSFAVFIVHNTGRALGCLDDHLACLVADLVRILLAFFDERTEQNDTFPTARCVERGAGKGVAAGLKTCAELGNQSTDLCGDLENYRLRHFVWFGVFGLGW